MENEKSKKKLYAVLRYVTLAVLALLMCTFEQTWFSLDIGGAPFFTAVLCAAVGYYTSIVFGMGFGMVVGLLTDAVGGSSIYVLPLLYLLYGALAGILGEHMYRTRPLSAIVPLGAVSALNALYRMFVLLIGCGFAPRGLGGAFVSLGLALLLTVLLGLPLFLLVRLIIRERSARKVRGAGSKGGRKRV